MASQTFLIKNVEGEKFMFCVADIPNLKFFCAKQRNNLKIPHSESILEKPLLLKYE